MVLLCLLVLNQIRDVLEYHQLVVVIHIVDLPLVDVHYLPVFRRLMYRSLLLLLHHLVVVVTVLVVLHCVQDVYHHFLFVPSARSLRRTLLMSLLHIELVDVKSMDWDPIFITALIIVKGFQFLVYERDHALLNVIQQNAIRYDIEYFLEFLYLMELQKLYLK